MMTWNVLVSVVQLVDAETQGDAELVARQRTQNACDHFGDVYEVTSFESEAQDEQDKEDAIAEAYRRQGITGLGER